MSLIYLPAPVHYSVSVVSPTLDNLGVISAPDKFAFEEVLNLIIPWRDQNNARANEEKEEKRRLNETEAKYRQISNWIVENQRLSMIDIAVFSHASIRRAC